MFNEPVDGYALAIFGIRTETQRNFLQESLQRVDITQGMGTATLMLDVLHNAFKNPEELVDAIIFINVTVFSAGGDTALAEKSGVRIARTPYRIQFFRMPGFFKPGMPFSIRVYVTNVDESPAVGVCICSGAQQSRTTEEGLAFLNLNTAAGQKVLEIEVQTCEAGLIPDQQARVTMTAHAYQTQSGSGNLLHIQADLQPPSVGSTLQLLLQIGQPNNNIKQFTILVLSKGQIVGAWVQPCSQGSTVTGWGLQVEPSMLPSFRVVAFYYLASGEIVADAMWLGIKDSCMGTLRVGPTDLMDMLRSFRPDGELRLMVTGDARALVGLVAVDQALLTLGKKNKLTQKKIWDMVERYDIACSAGSGQNHVGVFTDAGLDMVTNIGIRTVARTELLCPQQSHRRHRSLKKLERKTKVEGYEMPLERQCCMAGMQESPMGHTCEKRVHRVHQGPSCRAAFLDCCRLSQDLSQEERAQLLLGKSADYEDEEECWEEDCSEEMNMMVCSFFPESWLWVQEVLPNTTDSSGIVKHQIKTKLPHSITTWHILAVSMRKDRGIYVSAPYTVLVKLPFFVDLRLPPAAIRNEQLELRAVLYNYLSEKVRVRVEFPFQEGLCSAAQPEKSARQLVWVPQDLHCAGGEQQRLQRSIILDPRGKPQVELIQGRHLDNLVPDTEAEVFLSVQGNLLGETLVGGLELGGDVLQQLVVLPNGCVEQNIFRVTPNILLTHYLDAMRQWHRIGVDHRDCTIQHILHGYARQMQYRESDGSYFPYRGSTGSTWLTAYILKVFTMAHLLVNTIDLQALCSSAAWLIRKKQGSEGHFFENAPIYTPAMQVSSSHWMGTRLAVGGK
ncbi:hypothetical protein Y1Q_0017396 [Alligator mississippiensis]|uniref:Anaphylatoxin-like domain-containing protein n=1 Tax=Alligator mississippiensis TaxID=8496 RepID=A0A151N059_ALLMI|nr:hypothetical protein Y1Q_0017396 [Alligator mississippiensis]